MTKKDLSSLTWGASLGLAAFLTFWFFGRRLVKIPEVSPSLVRWEGQ